MLGLVVLCVSSVGVRISLLCTVGGLLHLAPLLLTPCLVLKLSFLGFGFGNCFLLYCFAGITSCTEIEAAYYLSERHGRQDMVAAPHSLQGCELAYAHQVHYSPSVVCRVVECSVHMDNVYIVQVLFMSDQQLQDMQHFAAGYPQPGYPGPDWRRFSSTKRNAAKCFRAACNCAAASPGDRANFLPNSCTTGLQHGGAIQDTCARFPHSRPGVSGQLPG